MDFFSEENADKDIATTDKPWAVLLVDDESEIHQVTKLVLAGFKCKNRGLDLISAYSGMEAREILENRDDIALALVDVVMETDHAGLDLVEFIRHDLNNKMIKLIIRTGQAGQASAESIKQEYDIDDYKEKTELPSDKLKALLCSMLHLYSEQTENNKG